MREMMSEVLAPPCLLPPTYSPFPLMATFNCGYGWSLGIVYCPLFCFLGIAFLGSLSSISIIEGSSSVRLRLQLCIVLPLWQLNFPAQLQIAPKPTHAYPQSRALIYTFSEQ